ncbi:MAG TPA: glycosyltransferase family 4 protein [Kineosporiaceae bacterium]
MTSRSAPQAPRRAEPTPPLIPAPTPPPDGAASRATHRSSPHQSPPHLQGLRGRHVLVVGPDDAPAGGGTSTPVTPYTTAVAEHLAPTAASVTVLTTLPRRPDGRVPAAYRRGLRTSEPGWMSPEQPRVVRLRRYSPRRAAGPGSVRQALGELTFLANAVSAGRRVPADVVIGVSPAGSAAAAAWLARRAGAPLITVVPLTAARTTAAADGDGADAAPGRLRGARRRLRRLAARVCPALERYALRHSAQVAAGSDTFRDTLLGAGVEAGRLHLLPAWSPVEPTTLSRVSARRELGWEPGAFLAVHAGPLGHLQDGVSIVEAARRLAGTHDGRWVEVVLVGEGPRRAALEQLAFGVPGVRFVDQADDDALPLVLAAADVLLVAETWPGGAATASGQLAGYLAAGRPVVAATWPGSPTGGELRRAGSGIVVPPGDPAALARALRELCAAGGRRAAMGRAAVRYARAHLGRDASLRRLETIVDAALAESRSR